MKYATVTELLCPCEFGSRTRVVSRKYKRFGLLQNSTRTRVVSRK
jgi:hypothetical protein